MKVQVLSHISKDDADSSTYESHKSWDVSAQISRCCCRQLTESIFSVRFAAKTQPFAYCSVVGGCCRAGAACAAKAVVRFVPIDGPLTPTEQMDCSCHSTKQGKRQHLRVQQSAPQGSSVPRLLRAEALPLCAWRSVRLSSSALRGHTVRALRYGCSGSSADGINIYHSSPAVIRSVSSAIRPCVPERRKRCKAYVRVANPKHEKKRGEARALFRSRRSGVLRTRALRFSLRCSSSQSTV